MKRILVISICVIFSIKTYAQDNVKSNIKLNKLIEQAFQTSPKIMEMQEMLKSGDVKVKYGQAGYLPVVSGDVSYRRLYPAPEISMPIGVGGQPVSIQFTPPDNYNASLNLNQPLFDSKVSINVKKAKSDLATLKDNIESYKMQLGFQVSQVYYSVVFINRSIGVQQRQLDLISSNMKVLDEKLKNGDALQYDFISTKVSYENAENNYIDLQNQLTKQFALLKMLTGENNISITDTIIDSKVFDSVSDSISKTAFENNLEIKVMKDRLATADWDIKMAKKLRIPVLTFQAGAGYRNGFLLKTDDLKFNYYLGLGLSVPILPSSRPGMQRKMAEFNSNSLKFALQSQELSLNKDILTAMEDIKMNTKKRANLSVLIEQSELALHLASERYKQGVITNLDLLTAQTNYQNSQLTYLQSEYYLVLSKMQLFKICGMIWW